MMLLLAGGLSVPALAQTRTLRIVTYNIEDDINGATTPLPGLIAPSSGGTVLNGGVLEGIGEEIVGNDPAQPLDILALQETTANTTTVVPIVNGLNSFYGVPGMYTNSTYQATESGGDTGDGNGPNAIVYNTTTVQLLASVPVDPPGGTGQLGGSSGEYREVMRYEFAPAGVTPTAANEFYIYVSHYKSGTSSTDAQDRAEEAQIIRNNSATLPATARILYVGDYNVETSSEVGYQTIVGSGINQGIDPMNPSGATGVTWETSALLNQKTESSTDLRYRDDLQICTTNVYYGTAGGFALVPGTYHVFGNNGTTAYEGNVSSAGNTSLNNLTPNARISATQLFQDLTTASDHLPMVADYTVPIPPPPPVASFTGTPTNGVAALPVTFTDTSTGAITNWYWIFGDGNSASAGTNVTAHTYTTPGTYSVTEVVTGPGGSATNSLASYITVLTPPPVASFTGTPTNGVAALPVTFTDTSTGAITNWYWIFGDGSSTNAATNVMAYTYTTPGIYSVTEVVTGPGGSATNSLAGYITVLTPPPVASFAGAPTTGMAALAVTFTDTSTGAITNWYWTFGDGNSANSVTNVTAHTYTTPGIYSVTEIVTGPGGSATNSLASYITVLTEALPAIQFSQSAGSLVLSWATPAIPYQLLSAPTPSGTWAPDLDTLSTNAGSVSVTLSPTNDQQYYRLQGL
jgi:PKD repeat protein